eukprot:TRINITY_DN19745_c0_g2_i1.p1 TRINITY_DN19745_c0_g2~~TRINITY_DN19745_c0_g2_i1.p1  ORF type:complete len:890 (-),score=213.80 TRINITY_DN19745_c0_g2_i1:44-2686(-)
MGGSDRESSADAPALALAKEQDAGVTDAGPKFAPALRSVGEESSSPQLDPERRDELVAEVSRLKAAKQKAVEDEEYEEAAVLKRRIKVLEDTLGQAVQFEASQAPASEAPPADAVPTVEKPVSELAHGETLWQDDTQNMRLIDEERIFKQRSKLAMRQRGVTDDTVQGVPTWAYKDTLKEGPASVKIERPAELAYVFAGQIEDEKWEEGANFQSSIVAEVPLQAAFDLAVSSQNSARAGGAAPEHQLQVGPGAFISHHAGGVAYLTELLGSEVLENEMVCFRVRATKPKVAGKVKLEAAQTVRSKEAFEKHPFYSFKSVWKLQLYPAGGTRIIRIVREFKQFELFKFDALKALGKSIELENEEIRRSWTSALVSAPGKAVQMQPSLGTREDEAEPAASLPVLPAAGGKKVTGSEMYSAAFVVQASPERAFGALISNELLLLYQSSLCQDSFLRLDEARWLLRRTDGLVLMVTSREKAEQRHWVTMTVCHRAGSTLKDALRVTSEAEVLAKPLYRVVNDWIFLEHEQSATLIRRKMRDFSQLADEEEPDLPVLLTEAADRENKLIAEAFEKIRVQEGSTSPPKSFSATAISARANYAMRQMPAILDHAAKNNVLEVREMLEVKGADPNYIHVRKDSWCISDSSLEFYEEITPLTVAAEYGACDVIKVLFNHPQIDVNLCCCAYNDLEIYNYYTAYDVTISRKHPHAAALLRARAVLPASSEHVFKPPFDRVHGRPLRETVNHQYNAEDDFGAGEMPRWDVVAEGNPALAEKLKEVAETLSNTKAQSAKYRARVFKTLVTEWHPDRHTATPEGDGQELATKIFQWLQAVKSWYLEEDREAGDDGRPDQRPLADLKSGNAPEDPDAANAREYMHPSGNLFSVW